MKQQGTANADQGDSPNKIGGNFRKNLAIEKFSMNVEIIVKNSFGHSYKNNSYYYTHTWVKL